MGTFIYYDSIDDYEEQFKKAMLYDALNEEQQTRKHWQDVAADHCLNEKLYEFKINEAIDYINKNRLSKFGNIDDNGADMIIDLLQNAF